MSLRSSLGKCLRDKLGITQLSLELERRSHFSQALIQFAVPEVIVPDEHVLRLAREEIRERYDIEGFSGLIHRNDLMFQHHLRKMPKDPAGALFHYFNVGIAALTGIRNLDPQFTPQRVLDFGSGYGRGSRFIPFVYQDCEVWVSEIKVGAMQFQKDHFGFETIAHNTNPTEFHTEAHFDLIIAISVFSHLPEELSRSWLRTLTSVLSEKGKMLFTYNALPADQAGEYYFTQQSEDQGLTWVPDRIKEGGVYGSAWYSDRRMKSVLDELKIGYKIIHDFSGSQSAVWLWK